MSPHFKIIGLTGGIASGKSTVARIFEQIGIPVVDADQLSRDLSSEGGAAHRQIVDEFGTADRKKLREMVFSNPEKRKKLESILHPLIQEETQEAFERILKDQKPPFIVYEAALLVETGRYQHFNGLIVVEAPHQLRLDRLQQRDGISLELAEKMIQSQLSDSERRKVATHTLQNDGSREALKKKIQDLKKMIENT